jgi:lysophospholipase L1-like esterase
MDMNTDDLENRLYEDCHDWMKGKPVNTALFGTVQASARIFIARALTTWRIAESSGETDKIATDFEAWLRAIVTDQLPPALEMAPDLVTLCAGGNDLLRPAGDPERMAKILDNTVSRLRANGSQVVLFTGVNIASGYMRGTIGLFARYYLNVRAIADRHDCFLVDQWSMGALTDARAWDADRLHMSSEGHRRLALRVCEVLGVPVEGYWNEPWPAVEPVRRAETLKEDLAWVKDSLGPWIGRRLTGRSSGDTVTAKRPELTPLTKER